MLPIIRSVASSASSAVKTRAGEAIKNKITKDVTNSERIKGLYSSLSSSNSDAQKKAVELDNKSSFEQESLTLLSSINSNTEELIRKFDDNNDKKGGWLSSLLGGLSMMLLPLFGKITKGLSILASPFKFLATGLRFVGNNLLKLLKFFKIGSLAKGAGAVAGGATKVLGGTAAKIGGAVGLGAIAAKIASRPSAKALISKVGKGAAIGALGKGAAKMGSKIIPGVGLAVGGVFAAKRAAKGDYVGALAEAASGIASTVPGIGTAAALAIQAGLLARDMSRKANSESDATIKSMRRGMDSVNDNVIAGSEKQHSGLTAFSANMNDMATKTKDTVISNTQKMLNLVKEFMPKMLLDIGSGVKSMIAVLADTGPKILNIVKNSVAGIVAFASSPLTAVINKIKSLLPGFESNDSGPGGSIANVSLSGLAKKNFNNVKGDLEDAASKFNVTPGLLAKIAYFESAKTFSTEAAPVSSNASRNKVFNKGAGKMAISSAHGLGQFTDARWYDTLRKDGGKMGIGRNLSESQMDKLRSNKRVQAMALASLAKDNLDMSASISGGDRATDVYVLHNLGQGGGTKFLRKLRSSPNSRVSSVMSSTVIRNNPSLYKGGNISVREAYNNMRRHISDGENFSGELAGGGSALSRGAKAVMAAPIMLASGAISAFTGKKSSSSSSSSSDMSDMGGQGVLKTGGKSRHAPKIDMSTNTKGRMSTSSPAGAANIRFDSPLSEKDGDRIAAAAEGMIGEQSDSFGLCARAVWFILGRAGIPGFPKTKSTSSNAKNWGASGIAMAKQAVPLLLARGFREVDTNEPSQNGDVDVLGPRRSEGDKHAGHIQVFANGSWYSDHKQSSRYNTGTYKWVKTFRYGNGGSVTAFSGSNTEPSVPPLEDENLSMPERMAAMMSTVFSSDKLDGLREFMKAGKIAPTVYTKDRASPIGDFKGEQETYKVDFKRGPNKNGTLSEDFGRVYAGSKDRQLADETGIRETQGFTKNNDRQLPDSTGIKNTPGFTKNPDRQEADSTGIRDTPGFKGSKDRQGKNGGKQKWWERLFGDGYFNSLLEGILPGFGGLFDLIQNKDYAGILGKVSGNEQLGKIFEGVQNKDYGSIIETVTGNGQLAKITKGIQNKDYDSVIEGVIKPDSNGVKAIDGLKKANSIYDSIKNKDYQQLVKDVLPTDKFIKDGLGKTSSVDFDNKIRMQTKQAESSILTPPAQSSTVTTGRSDGATLPISVRNNDSIIKEIAKDYLKNSM